MGFAHCGFFLDRLYNFLGTGEADPTMDPGTLQFLMSNCPISLETNTNVSADPKVNINQNTSTPFLLTNSFYQGLLNKKAVLQLDQELAFNATTLAMVIGYIAKPNTWRKKFAQAMIKMTTEEVLPAGEVGEIRLNCRVVNNPSPAAAPVNNPSPAAAPVNNPSPPAPPVNNPSPVAAPVNNPSPAPAPGF